MKHATVRIGGTEIPLIGIPYMSTQEICDWCHDYFHLQDVGLIDGEGFLCAGCREKRSLALAVSA